jgi:type II secretory pathway pseudopilin PulG
MSDAILMPAPGAKAAKVCGILAIVLALTCAGIPIAIVLGIVALVKHGKAKRLARAQPDVYEPVPATGLVTGIIGLALPVVMLPFVGIVGAIAIPAFLGQRERARELAVQSNLEAARARAEATVLELQTKVGRIPAQDAVIQSLASDPLILALRNPVTPSAPAFQRGTSGPLGTVMVYADQAQEGGVTTWSIQFRAVVRRGGQDRTLEGEVITHTQEQVHGRTEDGWEVVQPPTETQAPVEVQPPVEAPPQKPAQQP